jgi:polar amino acid transport system ATP-binding protein
MVTVPRGPAGPAGAGSPEPGGPTAGEILRASDLHKSYGHLEVLKGITLGVRQGEVLVLIGRSGSGKSTFLRCVNLLEVPSRGRLEFESWRFDFAPRTHPRGAEVRQLRRRIGMVFQQFNLWPHLTAERNVALALEDVLHLPRADARERARQALAKVGLGDKAASLPSQLSGGQQQRVAIARALALEPRLIMFDEVTSALDPELVQGVLEEMRRLAEGGMTMIVVTHEMGFAREVGDRVVFMDQGVVVEEGPARQVITSPAHSETRAFLRSIIH